MNCPHSRDEFSCDLPLVSSAWACVRKGVICKSEAFLVPSYKLMLSEMASNLVLFLFFLFTSSSPTPVDFNEANTNIQFLC